NEKIKLIEAGYIQDRNKLSEYYNAADLFIYPTRADSFGLVLLESIACGRPCITYAVGGCTDIIVNDVSGYAVTPFKPDEFANKIISVHKNRNLLESLKSSSRKFAKENFSISQMAKKYRELFLNELKR
ncbi:MAG: glycosyltransferase, partial [Nitrososphaeraceae archaeon]|nr:glycosyltransferase [Nitrososphaeraceae archaeon]